MQYCNVVMFFGKQFNQMHPLGPVIWFKNNPEYAHQDFRSFASEYFGESRALSQLFAVYKDCMCTIYRERSHVVASASSNKLRAKMATFDTDRARTFQTDYDAFCKLAFTNCFSKFNDYTMPILHTSNRNQSVEGAWGTAGSAWSCYTKMRCHEVHNETSERDENQIKYNGCVLQECYCRGIIIVILFACITA